MRESDNVVRECKAMAEEELRLVLETGSEPGPTNQPRRLEKAEAWNQKS